MKSIFRQTYEYNLERAAYLREVLARDPSEQPWNLCDLRRELQNLEPVIERMRRALRPHRRTRAA